MSSTQEVGEIFGEGSGPAHAMLRSPTVLIASVGLWGMNVFFFKLFGIDYVKVLKYDLDEEKKQQEEATSSNSHSNNSSLHLGGGGGGTSSNNATAMPTSDLMSSSKEYTSDDENDVYWSEKEEGGGLLLSDTTLYDDEDRDTSTINYAAITWNRLVAFSLSLLVLLHSTYWIWIDVIGRNQLGAVFAFYGAVTTAIVIPLPYTKWLRKATVLVLQRSFELINPRCNCVLLDANTLPRAIPFVDVFFADAMCSLSKVFFDWGMLFHMAAHYPHPVPSSAHNILIPSACAAVPFIIRARQCLIMYNLGRLTSDSKRFAHLANALKYMTSMFPLCLSAYQKTVAPHRAQSLEPLLLLLLVVNSVYALYWDVVMDWGMLQQPSAVCGGVASSSSSSIRPVGGGGHLHHHHLHHRSSSCAHRLMRPRLRFGAAVSALIVVADSVLRFSWTLRFYHALFPSGDSFVLCTQFLEVFRRALWNLLRVEWEHWKQKGGGHHGAHSKASSKGGSMSGDSGGVGMVPLLLLSGVVGGSNNNNNNNNGVNNLGGIANGGTGGVGGVGNGGSGSSVSGGASDLTGYIITKKPVKQATA